MIGSLFFIFNRMVEITFLIPIIGIMVSQCLFLARMANTPKTIHILNIPRCAGLLRRRLPQSQHAHTTLHPGPLHRQRDRRLLGHRYLDPLLSDQALSLLRLIH